jgi:ATP-dependent 26S proteasome regulatory subunit
MTAVSSIQFTRDGRFVLFRQEGALDVLDPHKGELVRKLPTPGLTDFAAFEDEVWGLAGGSLTRTTTLGREVAPPAPLPGAPTRMVPFTSGPSAVLCSAGDGRWTEVRDDLGRLSVNALGGRADELVPLAPRRWMAWRDGAITVEEADVVAARLEAGALAGARILEGSAIFEGRAAVFMVEQGAEQALIGLNASTGALLYRLKLEGITATRFAPRRGFALLRREARELVLVDLRFGKVVKSVAAARDVLDLCIDPDANLIALSFGDATPSFLTYRDFLVYNPASREQERPAPDLEPVPPAPSLTENIPLGPLLPRSSAQRCTRDEAIQLLDRHFDLVGAWAERAISESWDSGRLAFASQSGHPYEAEVIGILGRGAGRARAQLRTAEGRCQEVAAALRTTKDSLGGRATSLDELVNEFGLSPLAVDILIVVVGPTVWCDLARLYGIIKNDSNRPLVDEHLVCQLLGRRAGKHDVARELDRQAPLQRYGLLRVGEGKSRPFLSLSADPLIVRRLRGEDMDIVEPEEPTKVRHADRRLEELIVPADLVRDAIQKLAASAEGGFARVLVRGQVGCGRRTLLAALAAAANRKLGVIDTALLPKDGRALVESLRIELRRAVLRGWLPCVVSVDDLEAATRDLLRDVFRGHAGPITFVVGGDATIPLDPGYVQVDIPHLSESQRLDCWKRVIERYHLIVGDPDKLAARYRVGVGVIEKVAARVGNNPGLRTKGTESAPEDHFEALEDQLRQHIDVRLGAIATRVTRFATWSSVVLPEDIIDSIREFVGWIRHRKTVYEGWGYDRTMSTSRGLTALFQGGPGTGKTMVAGVIARELGLDLYRVDLSRVMSKWLGETEKNLAAVFDAAEDGQAIILFDEADSLFGKRTEVKSSNDRYANLEVNYLLQRLDSFTGICILTTNFGTSIDPAFKRRMSFRLSFPFPDEEMREQLWKVHLPDEVPKEGEFDLRELAKKYQLSGGYIRNASLRAAFLAAQEKSSLSQRHLDRAVQMEFREVGKLAVTGVLE